MMTNYLRDDTPVTLSFTVPRKLLVGLLVSAAEGGSNYWARMTLPVCKGQTATNYDRIHVLELEGHGSPIVGDPDLEPFEGIVTADDLVKGLERLATATFPAAKKHLADALSEDGDAITADVVLQMTVFGEVIYG